MTNIIRTVLIILMLLIATQASAAQEQNLCVVYLIDESGSFKLRSQAINVAKGLIASLKPGDVFIARTITSTSYSNKNHLFRLEIPRTLAKPQNQYDLKAWVPYRQSLQRVNMAKRMAFSRLAGIEPKHSSRTDLWGGIMAAAERLEHERGNGKVPWIVISSDMKENVGYKIRPDLSGIGVLIVLFQTDSNPIKVQKLKKYWREQIIDVCKAASLRFYPPDMKVVLPRSR